MLYLPLVELCSSLLRETAEEDVVEEENPADFSEDKIWLKACTSFIRTRYVRDADCRAEPLIDQYLLKPSSTYYFPMISLLPLAVRLLLRILQQQQSSFVLQHSENTLKCTDEVLQYLNPKESTLQALTQVMSEDLIPEKMREDNQDGESLSSICVQSFRDRWWSKILLTGVLETDGPSTLNTVGC